MAASILISPTPLVPHVIATVIVAEAVASAPVSGLTRKRRVDPLLSKAGFYSCVTGDGVRFPVAESEDGPRQFSFSPFDLQEGLMTLAITYGTMTIGSLLWTVVR